jgi:hypothetical protein
MKDLFGPKMASTSTSATHSPNLLRLFYGHRAVITMSPDEPTVSLSVSKISPSTNKIDSVISVSRTSGKETVQAPRKLATHTTRRAP